MAAAVGKYAANKVLKSQMKKYSSKKVEGPEDPLFALVEDPKRPGKTKKVKRQIPGYIPTHDAEVLAKVRKSAYRLDCALFSLFGIRFGWESAIGLIPAVGDAIGVLMALLVFKKCCSIEGGLENGIKLRMLFNIIADFLVGLVPFVGDLMDAAWKCNSKNSRLLEEVLDKRYKPDELEHDSREDSERRKKRRESGIYLRADPPPATAFEDFSDEERERSRSRGPPTSRPVSREASRAGDGVRAPKPARAPEDRRGGERGGWWGRQKSSRRAPDVEMSSRPAEASWQETGRTRR